MPRLRPMLHGYGSESNGLGLLSGSMSFVTAPEWFDTSMMDTLSQPLAIPSDPNTAILFSPDEVASLLDARSESQQPASLPRSLDLEAFAAEPNEALPSKSRINGPTHWMSLLGKYNQHGLFDHVVHVLFQGEGHPGIQKCKQLAREVKSRVVDPTSLSGPLQDFMPSREICDELIRLYLQTFEAVLRVLHVPSLQRDYLRYWSNPQAASEPLTLQLLLIMAIGTCFYHDIGATEPTLHIQAAHWIRACHLRLAVPCRKKDVNLRGIQSQCLLAIALLTNTNTLGGDLVWTTTASLVQNAMRIGLHISPGQFSVTPLDSEIRRRLWVTILELAVQSSLDSCNNPIISTDALKCEHPSNLNDIQINDSIETLPAGYPATTFTQSSMQRALLESLPIRLRIVEALRQAQGELSYATALRLGAELTDACRDTSKLMDTFL
ncbi:hypothetical protein B0I35DRAFT_483931 [Stachybotrys elegans]|uniref:Xylanolytic transcriptional activator regulatory domain-containing protein n=1 Tax=Stachybotrys elegans TaxID=80388 RepID=A0A8K0SGH0_9HYPO|nr:hypothetical protein B0I35DRAFT_483931 [Stachybotrys elegans]